MQLSLPSRVRAGTLCLFGISFDYLLSFYFRDYRNDALVATTFVEIHCSIYECVEGVVLTDTYIFTWVVTCTALANDDVACYTLLSTPNLNA